MDTPIEGALPRSDAESHSGRPATWVNSYENSADEHEPFPSIIVTWQHSPATSRPPE
eukprot:CAMPEP_0114549398 /NCGR_PEP_ID=MMETSP0114-20121206/5506_1 /TAXON_ID=31324 /ORGANISM="Goniomonas sp, Strain m" /LENGTH=56 /DNA_ID=CAMNT_0001734077 /DNA_START=375 /DNA_END=542 /DNA_ORIENTATION=-